MSVLKRAAIDDVLAQELRPGEQVRWVGQPVPSLFALAAWKPALGLAAVSAVGVVLLYVLAAIAAFVSLHSEIPYPASIVVGAGLFVTAFIAVMIILYVRAYKEARAMLYAITDHRAVIIYKSPRLQIDSYGPYGLWEIRVLPIWGTTGDLIFAKHFVEDGFLNVGSDAQGTRGLSPHWAIQVMRMANPALSGRTAPRDGIGFYAIADANEVENILHGTLKSGEPG